MKIKYILLVSTLLLLVLFSFNMPLFKSTHISNSTSHEITIGLYPLSNFDSTLLVFLQKEVANFYGYKVVILKGSALPAKAYYKARNRYRADTLLDYLLQKRTQNIDYMVGLTEKDISCTNGKYNDWGVFGLGFMPGRSCVISSFRLKPSAINEQHFNERLSKVVIHELGHNFGLGHCPNTKCIMRDAEGTIKSVDNEQKALCDECRKKLKKLMH